MAVTAYLLPLCYIGVEFVNLTQLNSSLQHKIWSYRSCLLFLWSFQCSAANQLSSKGFDFICLTPPFCTQLSFPMTHLSFLHYASLFYTCTVASICFASSYFCDSLYSFTKHLLFYFIAVVLLSIQVSIDSFAKGKKHHWLFYYIFFFCFFMLDSHLLL